MSDPFSIGIVCFPSFGGSGVVSAELAIGLAARGHRVHLIATELPRRIEGDHPGLHFEEVRVPDYPLFPHAPYGVALASRIFDVCVRHGLDLLQVHYALPHATSGVLARQLLGADRAPRLIASLHGTDVTHTGSDPAYRSIVSAAVAASDGITVPSAWLRDQARSRLGLGDGADIEVIGNFVDTDVFAPPSRRDRARLASLFPAGTEDGPILFHVSNFRPVKRTEDLIDALAILRRRIPARLVVVGEGPERERFETRAHELGLCGAIRFLDQPSDFAGELRHADAFLFPSESESFGLAALEALSSGVPVFGYQVGGLPEVVTPEVGGLVAPFDVEALAGRILEMLEAEGARDRMGAAARARVLSQFQLEPALDRYEGYFRRILGQTSRTP